MLSPVDVQRRWLQWSILGQTEKEKVERWKSSLGQPVKKSSQTPDMSTSFSFYQHAVPNCTNKRRSAKLFFIIEYLGSQKYSNGITVIRHCLYVNLKKDGETKQLKPCKLISFNCFAKELSVNIWMVSDSLKTSWMKLAQWIPIRR